MAAYTNAPWWADSGPDVIVVRGPDGDSICAMKKVTGDRLREEQESNCALISMAPELFRSVCELVAVMRASDVEVSPGASCESDAWDAAIEDAEALIELLAHEGVVLDESEASHD